MIMLLDLAGPCHLFIIPLNPFIVRFTFSFIKRPAVLQRALLPSLSLPAHHRIVRSVLRLLQRAWKRTGMYRLSQAVQLRLQPPHDACEGEEPALQPRLRVCVRALQPRVRLCVRALQPRVRVCVSVADGSNCHTEVLGEELVEVAADGGVHVAQLLAQPVLKVFLRVKSILLPVSAHADLMCIVPRLHTSESI